MSGVIMTPGVDSPCIGYCSTALGDAICRGCGRTFEEVTFWNVYSDEQKAAIMARLRQKQQESTAPLRDND